VTLEWRRNCRTTWLGWVIKKKILVLGWKTRILDSGWKDSNLRPPAPNGKSMFNTIFAEKIFKTWFFGKKLVFDCNQYEVSWPWWSHFGDINWLNNSSTLLLPSFNSFYLPFAIFHKFGIISAGVVCKFIRGIPIEKKDWPWSSITTGAGSYRISRKSNKWGVNNEIN